MADFDLPKTEEKILKFWKDRKIFERTLEGRKHARRFVFFEGPPTANGRPGIHHFFGRIIKDLFVRYKTMRGYLVERKAGWDTHGLPVEIGVEKELGLKNKKEIEKYGIAEFNTKAKESVWKYLNEWQNFTRRIGFWLDMENPYVTYDWKYIETLWWIIKQVDKQGLFYKGHKVLPWCPRCGTGLSSHEVAQGYEDITETSVYVKFKIKPGQKIGKTAISENAYFLAWTTTPWTLPGNVALAVGKNIEYVLVKIGEENYILAKNLAPKILPARQSLGVGGNTKYEILNTILGKDLVGLEYEPLFDIPHLQTKTAYKVYPADFVTTEDGTGIVHTAVMYGEDDYQLGVKLGLPRHHTVNAEGRFNDDVKGFEGRKVKEAEKDIISYLKSHSLLFKTEAHTHSYPFCWRCGSQLIYYAKDSWFVAMSKLRKQLLKNNGKINWVPAHLKHGRFGEFLKEAKDWAFSRERYWGTPLPVWQCRKCNEHKIVGSLEELEKNRYRPKNTFYILRHGISQKDGLNGAPNITAGKLAKDKYPLRPEGVAQIETTAKKVKTLGINAVFTSPFLRTRQSADIVAKVLGLRPHVDDRLRELDHGTVCEGREHGDNIGVACLSPGAVPTFDTKYGDGESWRNVQERMFATISEVDKKYEGKKILLISHGDPLWILEGKLRGMNDEEMIADRIKHYIGYGELREVDLKNYPYNDKGELDLHRPYIDEVLLKCEKCGGLPAARGLAQAGEMRRIKDVADVWFDSGAMPFAQWHYPFENKRRFSDNFPADFISEGIDQTRGWFYLLLAVSTLLGKGAPYKNVLSYSHVLDEKGKKMSKSLGDIVDPSDIISKYGVDAARWYFYALNDPGDPKLFTAADVGKKLNGFMMTLVNSLRFLELYADVGTGGKKPKAEPIDLLDEWVLSRLNNLIAEVTKGLDKYEYNKPVRAIEKFVVEDLSNWWIRRSREKFQRPKNSQELKKTGQFLRFLLLELSKILAPFAPFMADHIYKKLDNRKESVHLEDWPRANKKLIKPELEKEMSDLRDAVAEGLAQRKAAGVKVRQPLASIALNRAQKFESGFEELLSAELNVKNVLYKSNQKEASVLDKKLTPELITEGYAREIIRQIQDMRKEAKYKLDKKIYAAWSSDNADIIAAVDKFGKEITRDTLLIEFSRGHNPKDKFDIEKDFELAPQVKIWLGIRSKN